LNFIAIALSRCLKSFSIKLSLRPGTYSGSQQTSNTGIRIKSVDRESRLDGIYYSYESFRENHQDGEVDHESLLPKYEGQDGRFIKIDNSESSLWMTWGMTYEGKSYFRAGKFFYPIEAGQDTIVGLVASKHLQSGAFVPIITGGGLALGLAGAMIGVSASLIAKELNNHSVEFLLYEPTGELMLPNEWVVKSSKRSVIVACSPFLKKRVRVKVVVNELELCTIQKGEYFEFEIAKYLDPEDVCFVNVVNDTTCLSGYRAQSTKTHVEVLSTPKRGVELFELFGTDKYQLDRSIRKGKLVQHCEP